jgi:hypothetical protein
MDLPNWTSGYGSSPLPWLDSLLNCNVVLVVQRIGKSWQVNCGWVIAADLAAWTRLLGFCDDEDLREADPGHVPLSHLAHSVRLARELVLKISPGLARKDGSSPAGSGSAPCPHPPDQRHEP